MIHANTKIKIRNAVEAMSKKRGYFAATDICNQFGLDKTLSRLMREGGFLEATSRKGSRYIGPKPPSEAEYLSICKIYDTYMQSKTKRKKQNSKPAAPKQAAVQPQKNRVRLLWGLIDFTY